MKEHISNLIRRIASAIELDLTPTDAEIVNKKKESLEKSSPVKSPDISKARSNGDESESSQIKTTARPDIKPPRRTPNYDSKWNSKEHRRDYQREYRAEGNDVTNGNNYVKKNKGK